MFHNGEIKLRAVFYHFNKKCMQFIWASTRCRSHEEFRYFEFFESNSVGEFFMDLWLCIIAEELKKHETAKWINTGEGII